VYVIQFTRRIGIGEAVKRGHTAQQKHVNEPYKGVEM
jgi:hypothetical protein